MKVTVEDHVYDYDDAHLLVSEAMEVQEHTGLTMAGWQAGLNGLEPLAVKGLVYLLKKRAEEKVDWETLDFNLASVDFEEVEDEPDPSGAETNASG